MKTLLTILFLFSISRGICQENKISGIYWSDSIHYVEIGGNDTVEFFTLFGCCLMTEVYGKGTYNLYDSTLKVTTFSPGPGMISNHRVENELDYHNKVAFRVQNTNGPVKYCNILLEDPLTQKLITGISTDENGFAQFDNIESETINGAIIKFSSLGMDYYSIPLKEISGHTVAVELKPYRVIQNEIIEFRVLSENDSIYLSGPVFPQHKELEMDAGDKFRMVFTHWPWKWNFRHSHVVPEGKFEKE